MRVGTFVGQHFSAPFLPPPVKSLGSLRFEESFLPKRLLKLNDTGHTKLVLNYKTISSNPIFTDPTYPDLQILAVAPTNQRKGLGAMLISEGLADADRENARTYIEGSLHGLQLYLRHGWKQVDELVTDMGKYGGHGLTSVKCLLREPGGG